MTIDKVERPTEAVLMEIMATVNQTVKSMRNVRGGDDSAHRLTGDRTHIRRRPIVDPNQMAKRSDRCR